MTSFERGKFDAKWWAFALPLLLLVFLGAFAFYYQTAYGLIMTGMRTIGRGGSGWAVYIVFDIYFVGVSFAGIVVASLIRLFNLQVLKPISRLAELLAVVSLLLSTPCIFADLGRPLKGLLFLPQYARTMSPFFGTFTLVAAGYLFASLAYFYLAGRADAAYCAATCKSFNWFYRIWASGFRGTKNEKERHHKASFWLALAILPLLVTAHSTLGFIFGIQGGRPGWFNALQAPEFVVMAGISGLGILIIVSAILKKFLHLEEITPEAFKWLGNFLWVLIVAYLYFMIADELTANYASSEMERVVAHDVVFGPYAWAFWTVVAGMVIPFVIQFTQFAVGKGSIGLTVLSGALVNVAAILKRFLIVVPSQTYGMMLPYPHGSYHPTWVELSVIIGVFSLGILLYGLFIKIFPIIPLEIPAGKAEEVQAAPGKGTEKFISLTSFLVTLVLGIFLTVIGFLGSARFGTRPYLDPVVPFSPVFFIAGVILTFYSAAAYEVVPSLIPLFFKSKR